MIPRGRLAALTAAVLALTVLGAGAAASGAGPQAEKFRLSAELGRPDEVLAYGPSQLLLLSDFAEKPELFRINNDGSLDRSFGDGGKVETFFNGVTVAPDGKILLTGSGDEGAEVTRLLPDGSPDPAFGRGGTAPIDFGGAYDQAKTVAVDSNGGIVVAGTRQTIVDNRGLSDAVPAIGRLLPDGTVDRSFAGGGKRILDEGWEAGVSSVVPLPGGGVVATGEGYLGLVVWKLTAAGRMNPRFGKHGVLHLAEGRGWHHGYDWEEELGWRDEVAVLPSGKLLLAANGERYDDRGSHYRAVALRLKASGRIDRSFGRRGWVTATFGGDTFAQKLALLPHGISVLVVGAQSRHGKQSDLGLVAFNRRGKLYRHFGHRGKVRVDLHRQDFVDDATAQGRRLVILGYDQNIEAWLVGVPNL
jgi:uncharacterized delta-60 repeat protein